MGNPRSSDLAVSEIFGPTFQGEGRSIGQPAFFLRLGGCNLHCSWCDTKYTWDWSQFDKAEEIKFLTPTAIFNFLKGAVDQIELVPHVPIRRLVITGGEPLLQQVKLLPLLDHLAEHDDWEIEFETNGTLPPDLKLLAYPRIAFNVSPKLDNSGNGKLNYDTLSSFPDWATIFKFVVQLKDWRLQLQEVDRFVRAHHLRHVYVMPEGVVVPEIPGEFVKEIIQRGYAYTPRLHILTFGNRRGT